MGLLDPARVFGKETATLFEASIAQDLVNLFFVAPLTVILSFLSVRGSLRSWLCLVGVLGFTAYNYAIYAFSIHFGMLFPVWVTVLGLSSYTVAGSLTGLRTVVSPPQFGRVSVRLPGWFLMATAALFALLWLREIVSDLLVGRPSTSAITWNVPTNPVHVLDLAIFLPGVFVAGLLLLRRDPLGHVTAPGALIFLGLTSLPIMVSLVVAQANGHAPTWPLAVPMGIIALATLALLWRMLRQIGKPPDVLSDEAS